MVSVLCLNTYVLQENTNKKCFYFKIVCLFIMCYLQCLCNYWLSLNSFYTTYFFSVLCTANILYTAKTYLKWFLDIFEAFLQKLLCSFSISNFKPTQSKHALQTDTHIDLFKHFTRNIVWKIWKTHREHDGWGIVCDLPMSWPVRADQWRPHMPPDRCVWPLGSWTWPAGIQATPRLPAWLHFLWNK